MGSLLMLVRAGEVRNVRRQVTFPLMTIGPKGPIEWGQARRRFYL